MHRRLIPDVVRKQDIATLPDSATVLEAARLMQTRHIGSVLVTTEDGDLEGICTERDIVYRVVARGLPPDRTQLHQVMTRDPDTIGPRERAIEALRRMEDGGYRHLPIIEGGRIVGIVSRRDFYGEEKTQLEDETRLWEAV